MNYSSILIPNMCGSMVNKAYKGNWYMGYSIKFFKIYS